MKRFSQLFRKKGHQDSTPSDGSTPPSTSSKSSKPSTNKNAEKKRNPVQKLVDKVKKKSNSNDADDYVQNQVHLEAYASSNAAGSSVRNQQTRQDFEVNDASIVFSVSNLLSPEECEYYIESAESHGLKSVEWEYDREYRDCQRLVCQSYDLSEVLWNRLKHHLTRGDIENVRPFGWDNEGVWVPYGVNPCIRFTKYSKGNHFNPHKDGGFVYNEEHRSVYTLMIYLNNCHNSNNNISDTSDTSKNTSDASDDTSDASGADAAHAGDAEDAGDGEEVAKIEFSGGHTKFYGSKEQNKVFLDKKELAEGMKEGVMVTHEVVPRQGEAVVFNHDVWHEGCPVTSGTKYILRTDIMFKRVQHDVKSPELLQNPKFHECEALYQKSIQLQKEGDVKGSTLAYLEALTMQAKLASINSKSSRKLKSRTKDGYGKEIDWFASDIYGKIFSFLSWQDVVSCVKVSKAWHYLGTAPGVWKHFYNSVWPELSEYEKETCVGAIESKNDDPVILTPWYYLFKYRRRADKEFQVLCISISTDHVEFDMGFRGVLNRRQFEFDKRTERFKDSWGSYFTWDENQLFECETPMPAVFAWVAGHYWHCRSGRENAEVGRRCVEENGMYQGHMGLRWLLTEKYGVLDEDCLRNIFKYIFANGCEQWQQPEEYSILLTLPYWFDSEEGANYLLFLLYTQMGVPYVSIQSPAKMSLIGVLNHQTGLVISLEPRCLAMVSVTDGNEDSLSKIVLNRFQTESKIKQIEEEIEKQNKNKNKHKKDENEDEDEQELDWRQRYWFAREGQRRMDAKGGVSTPPQPKSSRDKKKNAKLDAWRGKKVSNFMNQELNGLVFRGSKEWRAREEHQKKHFLSKEHFVKNVLQNVFDPKIVEMAAKNDTYQQIAAALTKDELDAELNGTKSDEANGAKAGDEANSDGDGRIPVKTWKDISHPNWSVLDLLWSLYNLLKTSTLTAQTVKAANAGEDAARAGVDVVLVGPCCKDFEKVIKHFLKRLAEMPLDENNSGGSTSFHNVGYNVVRDDLKTHYQMVQEQIEKEKPLNWQPPEQRSYRTTEPELLKMIRVPNISSQRSGLLIGSIIYSQSVQVIRNHEFKDKAKQPPREITKLVDQSIETKLK